MLFCLLLFANLLFAFCAFAYRLLRICFLLFAGQTLFQLTSSGWWRLWMVEIVYFFDVRLIAGFMNLCQLFSCLFLDIYRLSAHISLALLIRVTFPFFADLLASKIRFTYSDG